MNKYDPIPMARIVGQLPLATVPNVHRLLGHDFKGRRVAKSVHIFHNWPVFSLYDFKPWLVVV